MTHLTQTQHVMGRFGGRPNFVKATGFPDRTVRFWEKKGCFPTEKYPEILRAAVREGVPLTSHDFVVHLDAEMAALQPAATETPGSSPAVAA